ncbi:MAG: hypothetical protein QF541_13550, partial [Lentisphaeria bacterium]|nr:hypothetical protein [Lentisphaeria bacterium]
MESNTETIEGGSADETNDVEVAEEQQASGNWYVVQTLSASQLLKLISSVQLASSTATWANAGPAANSGTHIINKIRF